MELKTARRIHLSIIFAPLFLDEEREYSPVTDGCKGESTDADDECLPVEELAAARCALHRICVSVLQRQSLGAPVYCAPRVHSSVHQVLSPYRDDTL